MTAIMNASRSLSPYSRDVDPCTTTSVTRANIAHRPEAKWDNVLRSLYGLKSLQDNWDGQGSAAPSADLIQSAVELAEFLRRVSTPPTTAVATPAGTILFSWEDQSTYYEIEVMAPYRAEWMFVDQNGVATHGVVSTG